MSDKLIEINNQMVVDTMKENIQRRHKRGITKWHCGGCARTNGAGICGKCIKRVGTNHLKILIVDVSTGQTYYSSMCNDCGSEMMIKIDLRSDPLEKLACLKGTYHISAKRAPSAGV